MDCVAQPGRQRIPAVRLVLLAACGVLLVGCSDDATPKAQVSTTVVTTTPRTVAPDGTTVPGTVVALGQQAVVRWRADKAHDSVVTLTVTAAKRGKVKDLEQFSLNGAARSSSVYYVSVAVRNTGDGDLSGQTLTLYGKVSKDLVVPPVVLSSTFDRCGDQPLPAKFTTGAKAQVCILMLAPHHGSISEVQWRGPGNTEPIGWRVR